MFLFLFLLLLLYFSVYCQIWFPFSFHSYCHCFFFLLLKMFTNLRMVNGNRTTSNTKCLWRKLEMNVGTTKKIVLKWRERVRVCLAERTQTFVGQTIRRFWTQEAYLATRIEIIRKTNLKWHIEMGYLFIIHGISILFAMKSVYGTRTAYDRIGTKYEWVSVETK